MNVKQLREELAALPDDSLVVTSGFDHSFQNVFHCRPDMAELMPDGHMAEYWDDENLSYPESKKIKVVVIE